MFSIVHNKFQTLADKLKKNKFLTASCQQFSIQIQLSLSPNRAINMQTENTRVEYKMNSHVVEVVAK